MRVTNERPASPRDLDTVYLRDASFNATGHPSGRLPRLHFEHPNAPGVSACCRVLLSSGYASDSVDDPARGGCQQAGCRDGWLELERRRPAA